MISRTEVDELNRRLKAGEKLKDIAKDMGLSYEGLYMRLRTHGYRQYQQWDVTNPEGKVEASHATA